MKFTSFASLIREYTGTNATTFSDARILLLANTFKDDFAAKISKYVGEDYFGLRFTRDLVANQREYDLPAETMPKMKYLEAKLDGTKWSHLLETDLPAYKKTTDEATIREIYADRDPAFDIFDRSFFIYSGDAIISVTSGLQLWAIIWPADFTDLSSTNDMAIAPSATSHGLPRQFHELLARRISIAFKSSKDKPIPLSESERNFAVDFADTLASMKSANLDRAVTPAVPYDDGSDY